MASSSFSSFSVENLLHILNLEPLERNLYRGLSPQVGWQRVFGGLVISQALIAASRTVEQRVAHSLHAYFLRPGDPQVPLIYEVDRIRDGNSFTTRRVVAIQHGEAIFSLSASFHKLEEGYAHQVKMPDVPMPETLPSEADIKDKFMAFLPENVRRYWERERPIELRPTDLTRFVNRASSVSIGENSVRQSLEPRQYVWFRSTAALPDDAAVHQAVLAYASDMTLLDSSLLVHGRSVFDADIQAASLDHALWFHRPFKADQWLLYAQDSPNTGGARGFARGSIFTREGVLVASVAQEGLIRPVQQK